MICRHFFHDFLDTFIRDFNSSIHLRPVYNRIEILDVEFVAYFSHNLIFKFLALSDTITSGCPYRQMIEKVGYYFLHHFRKWGGFHPFGKIVNHHEYKLMSITGFRLNWTNDIHPPHWEGSEGGHIMKFIWRSMNDVSMNLALIARLTWLSQSSLRDIK